ncbi:rCG39276 [Rattus norvegicus]|uniref:RCG39276 n=1 Tax=Rattus norvegicus TaxID=10116 RepID=A6I938_RAT|nr:rCG39276 [Rattus norvegicus]
MEEGREKETFPLSKSVRELLSEIKSNSHSSVPNHFSEMTRAEGNLHGQVDTAWCSLRTSRPSEGNNPNIYQGL